MNATLLTTQRDATKQAEDFWFAAHRDATDDRALNDYGWLWQHFKEAREKLDEMVEGLRGSVIGRGQG